MKILEMKATWPEAKPNAKFVINTEKIEQVGINGSTVEVSTGDDSTYHEYYPTAEEAEHRYDEILLQLTTDFDCEPAVMYRDNVPTITLQPVDTSYNPCEFTIHTYPDKIEVVSSNNAVSYPIGPDRVLLNVQSAFKELASDIYSEIYEYYSEGQKMPIGAVEHCTYISLESDDELITKIMRNAIRLSNDKTCPAQIFVRYSGHVNSFDIDIHINGWESGSEPDFKFSAPSDRYTTYAQTTILQSLDEVDWLLTQLDYYAQADPSGKYLSRLRAALFERRPQIAAEEASNAKTNS